MTGPPEFSTDKQPIQIIPKNCIRPGWVMVCRPAPNHTALLTYIIPIGGDKDVDEQMYLDNIIRIFDGIQLMQMGYPMIAPEDYAFVQRLQPERFAKISAEELGPEQTTEIDPNIPLEERL